MAFRGTGLGPFFGSTPLFSLRREIDRLFDDAVGGPANGRERSSWAPAVDVREDQKEILMEVELPGIRPENVEISVDNGVLNIRGEKREERKEGEEGRYHLIERRYGSFARSVVLPSGVDEEQISANFDQGVLTVRIPKAALPKPKRIEIKNGVRSGGKVEKAEKPDAAKRG